MYKLTLLLIPLLLLSSCGNKQGTVNVVTEQIASHTTSTVSETVPLVVGETGSIVDKERANTLPNFRQNFSLKQVDTTIVLDYDGKHIQGFNIPIPKKIPFIVANQCDSILGKDLPAMNINTENPIQQKKWDTLTITQKGECIKDRLYKGLESNTINNNYLSLHFIDYETGGKGWIIDISKGKSYETDGTVQDIIFDGETAIAYVHPLGYGDSSIKVYDSYWREIENTDTDVQFLGNPNLLASYMVGSIKKISEKQIQVSIQENSQKKDIILKLFPIHKN